MKSIGDRIRSRRLSLHKSQDSLANELGFKSRSSINKIEKGLTDIPQSRIEEFAKALNTTPSYLLGWVNDPTQDWNQSAQESINDYNLRQHYLYEAGLNANQIDAVLQFIELNDIDQKVVIDVISSLYHKQVNNYLP